MTDLVSPNPPLLCCIASSELDSHKQEEHERATSAPPQMLGQRRVLNQVGTALLIYSYPRRTFRECPLRRTIPQQR